jgi:hypothetical protein
VTDEEKTELARTADQILAGKIDLLEGCRQLVRLHRLSGAPDSEAILTILGIESETDSFPIGQERELWATPALAASDRERDEYLKRVHDALCVALATLSEQA